MSAPITRPRCRRDFTREEILATPLVDVTLVGDGNSQTVAAHTCPNCQQWIRPDMLDPAYVPRKPMSRDQVLVDLRRALEETMPDRAENILRWVEVRLSSEPPINVSVLSIDRDDERLGEVWTFLLTDQQMRERPRGLGPLLVRAQV